MIRTSLVQIKEKQRINRNYLGIAIEKWGIL